MKYNLNKIFQDKNIIGLATDSRKVKKNYAYFALKGNNFNGDNFISEALERGAAIIFTESANFSSSLQIYKVENIRSILASAIELIYPALPKYLLAVTGTSGKTSITSYCRQLISFLGHKSANVGTNGVECCDEEISNLFKDEKYQRLTTADQITFREILHILAKNNINYVAFEASSHGLHQGRLGNIKVDAASFVSFSHEHLDYHKNMANYLKAKLILFGKHLKKQGIAIINQEINEIEEISKFLNELTLQTIYLGQDGDLKIISSIQSLKGQVVSFNYKNQKYIFETEIVGKFQVINIIIATLLVSTIGFNFSTIVDKISKLRAVRGRLERINLTTHHFNIFVDYAHKPDALLKVLSELNILKRNGRLKVIFGCGGERDKEKRPLMGKIATTIANEVIITDDNPRNENADSIRKEILDGCISGKNVIEIANREEAIEFAINNLKKDDILLIAGKGHEDYQIIGDTKYPFDDVKAARKSLGI